MVRRNSRYSAGMFGWALLVFGATVAVFSGRASPYLTPSMLPVEGPLAMVGFAVGLLLLGGIVVGQLRKRAWRRAGRRADLAPDGGGLLGTPELTGTRGGRNVRVRTIKRSTGGGGGEGGSSEATYTVVEADLREAAEDGLFVARADGSGRSDVGELTDQLEIETESVGEFEAVGSDVDLADEVLTDRVRTALREPDPLDAVAVGNAAEPLLEAVPDADGTIAGMVTSGLENKIESELPGDASTVRTETKGLVLDGRELDRLVAAVDALADEFEAVQSRQRPESTP